MDVSTGLVSDVVSYYALADIKSFGAPQSFGSQATAASGHKGTVRTQVWRG